MWQSIQFFDDPIILQNLRPLTYIRKLSELWIGMHPIAQKWQAFVDPNQQNSHPKISLLGSLIPTSEIINEIKQLKLEEALYFEGHCIARMDSEIPFENLTRVTCKTPPVFVKFLENILSIQLNLLPKEINSFLQQNHSVPENLNDLGNVIIHPQNCFIDPSAQLKGTIIDASQGPVFIGAHVNLQIGTLIQGPAALLAGASTNIGAKIRPNTTIGPHCKVGGEINHSIFYPFSNKGHDGYAGSSVVGSFCNWGALTCTSNVRNDLKEVQLFDYPAGKPRKTDLASIGVIMGDFVTTGIGTKFNTGTVVGNHCNISGSHFLPTFIPSLTWGEYPKFQAYDQIKALENAKKWAELKKQKCPDNLKTILSEIWKEESTFRN